MRRRRPTVFVAMAVLAVVAGATVGRTTSSFSSTTSTPVNTFSAAASFGGSCPSTAPTGLAMMTGFESGYINSSMSSRSSFLGNIGAGTVPVDSVVRRNGAYSARIAAGGAATNRAFAGVTTTTMVAHFAVRLAALPTTDVQQLFSVTNGQPTGFAAVLGYRYNSGTPKLAVQMRNASGVLSTAVQSTTTVAAEQWYVVDVLYDSSGTTHTLAWQVDGTTQAGTSQAGTAGTFAYSAHIGTTVAATYTANYDDVLFSTAAADYPLPDATVRRLVPSGQGTNNLRTSMTNETGGTADAGFWWQKLDETPAGSTDYVIQNAIDTAAYAEFAFQDTTDTCVLAVVGTLFSTAGGGTKNAKSEFRVIDGATTRSVWNNNMDVGTAGSTHGMGAFIPPVGATWTTAELNGLVGRIGFTSLFPNGAVAPRWDGLALEYLTVA